MPQLFFWLIVFCSVGALVFSFVRLKQAHQITAFDILAVPLPFALWWVLAIAGWKVKSLSNLIEPLSLLVLVPLVLLARVSWVKSAPNNSRALVSFAICLLLAGGLYAFVPVLPE